jgi:hypothetical protein
MDRAITPYKAVKVLAIMVAIWQLTACGGGSGSTDTANGVSSNSAPVVSSSGQVSTGISQSYDLPLSWVAPMTRADGSPISLADIDGYRVYFGNSSGNYPDSVDVTGGDQTSVTVTGVTAGTYYVVMTTYDINGLESAYSNEIIKTVQ